MGYLGRALKKIGSYRRSTGMILLYHRVADLSTDPQLLCVSPKHFKDHLDVLTQDFEVQSLATMVQHIRKGKMKRRSVAITFDDGYADNLLNAKPILSHCGMPATVFVTSGYIGSDREFWWDNLESLLLKPGELPENLNLNVNGQVFRWNLGTHHNYSQEDHMKNLAWNVLEPHTPTARHSLYMELCELLRPLCETTRRDVLGQIRSYCKTETITNHRTNRSVTPQELKELRRGSIIEIGAHSVTHSLLSKLSVTEQRDEIRNSKDSLEKILGVPVTSFSYPFGTPSDYTAETQEEIRSAGFECACSNFSGTIDQNTSPWELPRVLIRDWPAEVFKRRLEQFYA